MYVLLEILQVNFNFKIHIACVCIFSMIAVLWIVHLLVMLKQSFGLSGSLFQLHNNSWLCCSHTYLAIWLKKIWAKCTETCSKYFWIIINAYLLSKFSSESLTLIWNFQCIGLCCYVVVKVTELNALDNLTFIKYEIKGGSLDFHIEII